MTPEKAHEEGKRAAAVFTAPGAMPAVNEVEHFIATQIAIHEHITPFHIRGAAAYFRDLAIELEARAAALESTR